MLVVIPADLLECRMPNGSLEFSNIRWITGWTISDYETAYILIIYLTYSKGSVCSQSHLLDVSLDLPVQTNTAKFQFNGMTGYHLKPWVMNREGAKRGIFNPFVQTKLEDIVPAKLQIKVCTVVHTVYMLLYRVHFYQVNYVHVHHQKLIMSIT